MDVTVTRDPYAPRVLVSLELSLYEARVIGRLAHSHWRNTGGFAWKIADAIELAGIELHSESMLITIEEMAN